jgi:initiation factor 1A
MPNQHGGKAYKKGSKKKVQQQATQAARFNGCDEGQDYARITRMLGNRRVMCFCNDGVERVGKIRGSLCRGPKRQTIAVGDIVITSARNFNGDSDTGSDSESDEDVITHVATPALGRKEIVDILEKVAPAHWRKLHKTHVIHKDLIPNTGTEDDIFESSDVQEKADDSDIDIAGI